jgi:hypothetical protein
MFCSAGRATSLALCLSLTALREAQEHSEKCEESNQGQEDCNCQQRRMRRGVGDPGNRFELVASEIVQQPAVFPQRDEQADDAGPDKH